MARIVASLVLILSVASPALAGEDYRKAAEALPEYQKGPPKVGPDGKPLTKTICGWLLYSVKQKRTAKRWSQPIVGLNLNRQIHVQEPCSFPKKSKWKKLERKLAKSPLIKESGYPFKKGDLIYVMNAEWDVRRHPMTGVPLSREMSFQHFSKAFEARLDKCGSLDGKLICEHSERDNRVPSYLNEIHWRLKNAEQMQADKKNRECAVRAYRAMTVVKGATGIANSMRRSSNDKRYATRFDGTLDAKAVYALFKSQYDAAKTLFLACGGTEEDLGFSLRKNPIR